MDKQMLAFQQALGALKKGEDSNLSNIRDKMTIKISLLEVRAARDRLEAKGLIRRTGPAKLQHELITKDEKLAA